MPDIAERFEYGIYIALLFSVINHTKLTAPAEKTRGGFILMPVLYAGHALRWHSRI